MAHPPIVSVQALPAQAGDPINEVPLEITATLTDTDNSEYISELQLTGLPAGVMVSDPNGIFVNPDQTHSLSHEVDLTLPPGQTTNFDLGVTAFADKKGDSGGLQEASATTSQHIELDHAENIALENFLTENQNIWGTGSAFTFDDNRFLGIDDTGPNALQPRGSLSLGVPPFQISVDYGANLDFKIGLQSDLHLTAGDITADLPFDITLDTDYNKTNDTLLITPIAALAPGAQFSTHGPSGQYNLDFIFQATKADAFVDGVDASLPGLPYNIDKNVVNLDSRVLSKNVALPDDLGNLTFNWPQLDSFSGEPVGNTISSDVTSKDIVGFSVDLAAAVSELVFDTNIFKISDFPLVGDITLLSTVLSSGINLQQHFDLNALGLNSALTMEDGSALPFSFGSPLVIQNASTHDTNEDGKIGFDLNLAPNATLQNDLKTALNVGADITAGQLGNIFTIYSHHVDIAAGSVDLVNTGPFTLNFPHQDYLFSA